VITWDSAKIVAFDFETSGTLPEYALQPWRIATGDFWVTSVSVIAHRDNQLVPDGSALLVGVTQENVALYIRTTLMRAIANDWTLLCWFGIFDISICVAYGCGDLVHKVKWLDGMLLLKHARVEPEYDLDRSKKKSYRLKDAVREFLPVSHHNYEDDIDFHATDPASLVKLVKYGDRDGVYTWVISKVVWGELTPRQRNAAVIEAECLSMVAEANFAGMPVDMLIAAELSAKLTKTAADMLVKLAPHGVDETIVRSPTKMAKLLFDDWGLPVFKENTGKKTGKISRATDKEVLHELAFIDPRCADLRGYREALNNRTKFAETPMVAARYNGDARARPSAIVFGTYSGRLTYSSSQGKGVNTKQTGFALHQEKRGADFRSIIAAPPGYTLMEFDASGQEFRWMAILSGDTTMLQLCQPGEDPHSYMGGRVAGIPYAEVMARVALEDAIAKNARQLGKVANLSLQYRTYPKTLRKVARVDFNIPRAARGQADPPDISTDLSRGAALLAAPDLQDQAARLRRDAGRAARADDRQLVGI
jgi:hypothetical protein